MVENGKIRTGSPLVYFMAIWKFSAFGFLWMAL